MSAKKLYRCTRHSPYEHPGIPGYLDTSARQGHYIEATSPAEALDVMRRDFPADAPEVRPGVSYRGKKTFYGAPIVDADGFTAMEWN